MGLWPERIWRQTALPKSMPETARLSVFEKEDGRIAKETVRLGVWYPAMVLCPF